MEKWELKQNNQVEMSCWVIYRLSIQDGRERTENLDGESWLPPCLSSTSCFNADPVLGVDYMILNKNYWFLITFFMMLVVWEIYANKSKKLQVIVCIWRKWTAVIQILPKS